MKPRPKIWPTVGAHPNLAGCGVSWATGSLLRTLLTGRIRPERVYLQPLFITEMSVQNFKALRLGTHSWVGAAFRAWLSHRVDRGRDRTHTCCMRS